MGISVVVPVFNSQDSIQELVDSIRSATRPLDCPLEMILVDDGSTDASWQVIRSLARSHRDLTGIRLARNFGEQNAVLCGIRAATHAVTVTIDDDLQQPPDAIPALVAALTDGVDLVYGVAQRHQHSTPRRISAVTTKWILDHVFRVVDAASVTSFRAFRTQLREGFGLTSGPRFSIDGLLATASAGATTVDVDHRPARVGSRYTTSKLVEHTMSTIVDRSTSPLLFATVIGLGCVIAAILCAPVTFVIGVSTDRWHAGWALIALGLLLNGAVLVGLGILGEYAARILARVAGEPSYIVRETVQNKD